MNNIELRIAVSKLILAISTDGDLSYARGQLEAYQRMLELLKDKEV